MGGFRVLPRYSRREFLGNIQVLAFADDVHFLAPPKLAVAAMARWEFLYGRRLDSR